MSAVTPINLGQAATAETPGRLLIAAGNEIYRRVGYQPSRALLGVMTSRGKGSDGLSCHQ